MATMNAVAFRENRPISHVFSRIRSEEKRKRDNYSQRIISQRWSKDEGKQEIAAAVVVRKNLKSMKEKGF